MDRSTGQGRPRICKCRGKEHAPAPLATAFFRNTISTSAGPASANTTATTKPSTAAARASRARDTAIPRDESEMFFLPKRAKGKSRAGEQGWNCGRSGVREAECASEHWLRAASGRDGGARRFHRLWGSCINSSGQCEDEGRREEEEGAECRQCRWPGIKQGICGWLLKPRCSSRNLQDLQGGIVAISSFNASQLSIYLNNLCRFAWWIDSLGFRTRDHSSIMRSYGFRSSRT